MRLWHIIFKVNKWVQIYNDLSDSLYNEVLRKQIKISDRAIIFMGEYWGNIKRFKKWVGDLYLMVALGGVPIRVNLRSVAKTVAPAHLVGFETPRFDHTTWLKKTAEDLRDKKACPLTKKFSREID